MEPGDRRLAVVTGGAGFIGSHLADALVASGRPVRVVDNLSTGRRSNLEAIGGSFEWLEGDLSDPELAAAAVTDADVVFHQAAIPSVPRSVENPWESHQNGPSATLNVLEASRAAGVRRVIFAASSSAYGESETLPKHEGMAPDPLSPYAAGKLAGEHYIRVYARTMGVDGISLRYFNVFGPRQDPSSPYSGVISLFIKWMSAGIRPRVFGDGSQTRDFTYISNVVRANLLAMESLKPLGGNVVNIGTGTSISLLDLINQLNQILGRSLEPEFLPPRAGDVRHSLADLGRARDTLGYEPIATFEAGLAATVAAEGPRVVDRTQ